MGHTSPGKHSINFLVLAT